MDETAVPRISSAPAREMQRPDHVEQPRRRVAAVMRGEADGIGLSLMDSGLGAIDLDHCVNGDSSMEPWAEQLHAEARRRARPYRVGSRIFPSPSAASPGRHRSGCAPATAGSLPTAKRPLLRQQRLLASSLPSCGQSDNKSRPRSRPPKGALIMSNRLLLGARFRRQSLAPRGATLAGVGD